MFKREEFLERLLCVFFPSRCVFCGKVLPPMGLECSNCQNTVNRIKEPVCMLCGCEKKDCCCKNKRYFYRGIASPLYYEDKVRRAFKIFKFQDNTVAARLLGEMMAQTAKKLYSEIKFDMITYVPMTQKKLRQRGYNQSELLAKEVAKHLDLKVEGSLLSKIYENDIQHDLNS
jgi:predicted amidophosphoribosyltransferase